VWVGTVIESTPGGCLIRWDDDDVTPESGYEHDALEPARGQDFRPEVKPVGSTVREGQCEHVGDTIGGLRRCVYEAGHAGPHALVGVAS
jgi:hypothetical protein